MRLLRWQDVDFESRVIHFVHVKGGRSYSVPMSSRLLEPAREWTEKVSQYYAAVIGWE